MKCLYLRNNRKLRVATRVGMNSHQAYQPYSQKPVEIYLVYHKVKLLNSIPKISSKNLNSSDPSKNIHTNSAISKARKKFACTFFFSMTARPLMSELMLHLFYSLNSSSPRFCRIILIEFISTHSSSLTKKQPTPEELPRTDFSVLSPSPAKVPHLELSVPSVSRMGIFIV